MKQIFRFKACFLLIALLLLVFSGTAFSGEQAEEDNKADVTVGADYVTVDDSPEKLGEFLPYQDGSEEIISGFIRANVSLMNEGPDSLSLYGQFLNNDQYRFGADFYSPRLQMFMDVNSFYHFLDKDTLKNYYILENPNDPAYFPPPGPGVGAAKRKVWKDDFGREDTHGIQKSRINMGLSFDAISDSNKTLTPYMEITSERRSGHSQSLSFSMCSSCHIQGRTRELDDQSNEIKIGTTFTTARNFVMDVSAYFKRFDVSAEAPLYTPNSIFSPFDYDTWTDYGYTIADFNTYTNVSGGPKLLYGGKELPYDMIPEYKEFGGELDFSIPITTSSNLYLNGIYTSVEGDYNDIDTSHAALSALYAATPLINSDLPRPLKFMSITFNARYENIDVDNSMEAQIDELTYAYDNHILWDVGTVVGQTNLTKYYNIALDQLVEPSLSRDVLTGEFNVSMPFSRNNLFKFSYIFSDIDRDNFEISDTTSHKFRAMLRGKFAKNLRYRFNTDYEHTNNPFGNTRAVGDDAGNPGDLVGVWPYNEYGSYLTMNELRKQNVTNLPEDKYSGRFELTYSPAGRYIFNWNIGYTRAENDWATDLDNRSYFTNLSATLMPTTNTNFTVSYGYNRAKIDSTIWQSTTIESFGVIKRSYGNYSPTVEDGIRSSVASCSISHIATQKLSFDGTVSYIRSSSGFTSPGAAEIVSEYDSTKIEDVDISALNVYSELDYDIWETAFGMEYKVTQNASIAGSVGYSMVDDDFGYVYGDLSGDSFNGYFAVRWTGL